MNEVDRWAGRTPSRIPSREERQAKKAAENLVRETRLAALRVDAEAALTGRIMDRAVDVDQHRKRLAGNDEALNAVLTRIELTLVDKLARHQRDFGSEFSP